MFLVPDRTCHTGGSGLADEQNRNKTKPRGSEWHNSYADTCMPHPRAGCESRFLCTSDSSSCQCAWEGMHAASSTWLLDIHVGVLDGVPGSPFLSVSTCLSSKQMNLLKRKKEKEKTLRPGAVAEQLKSLSCTGQDPIRALVLNQEVQLLMPLPACGLGK